MRNLFDLAVERALLGSVLVEPQALYRVLEDLSPDDFNAPAHKRIYGVMMEIAAEGKTVDIALLTEKIKDQADRVVLGECMDGTPDFQHVEDYANIVRKYSNLRGVLAIARDAASKIDKQGADDALIADEIERDIAALMGRSKKCAFVSGHALQEEVMRELETSKGGRTQGALYTGFNSLDALLVGFRPGNLCYIGGRSGMGKSALALAIALNLSKSNKRVAFMSLEMTGREQAERMVSLRCGIPLEAITKKNLTPEEVISLGRDPQNNDFPIEFDDTPGVSVLEIKGRCRRMKMQKGLDLIIIDHIHKMHTGKRNQSRNDELGEISNGLKNMAKELNVPVLCLAQLNREVEKADRKNNRRPKLSDLRESGNLEQDADLVMMLYRPDYYESNPMNCTGTVEIGIVKQRQGATGTATLKFRASFVKFMD